MSKMRTGYENASSGVPIPVMDAARAMSVMPRVTQLGQSLSADEQNNEQWL